LGTGTILAAEMARISPANLMLGEVVAAAYASMTRPLDRSSAILSPHAHAMTDVTGFGLAGHLLEMLTASKCSANISMAAIPLLAGAMDLAAMGIASSLAPANRAATAPRMQVTQSPVTDLLFDPQTAGGLLAAVPADQAQSLLRDLQAAGEPAALIGQITQGPAFLTVL
ncbi:MAG: AIR synthase-related protein, partial [Paracoccaceae bacterium]